MFVFSSLAISVTLLFALLSCTASNNTSNLNFPETITVSGKELVIDGVYMRYPFRIGINGSRLFLTDIHATDYYCHHFEYPSMKYLHGFAKRGEAPNEFLDIENIRFDNNSSIWTLDANKMKISNFSLNNPSTEPGIEIKLNKELIRTLDFVIFNDSIFIVPDYTGENRLCFINHKGETTKRIFSIPSLESDRSSFGTVKAQAWRSFMNYNPNNGLLAMVTQLGQVIEIYDLKNDSIIKVVNLKNGSPKHIVKGNYAIPTGIMGYSDVYVGKENIYAVFWGYSFDDIRNNKVEKEGGKYIHVFDLLGNPVRQYILDRHITGFYIDEENKRIIALDVNSNQPIIEYSLL